MPVPQIAAHSLLLLLLQAGLLLVLALLLGRVAVRFGMPAVVGELCVGILLGPTVLDHLWPGLAAWLLPKTGDQFHLLDSVGQIGVVLLVGITGIELDFGLVRKRGATALRISLAGLIIPLALGVGAGLLMPAALLTGRGDQLVFALFLGVAMCVSAIPVIAKTLADMNLVHRNIGQLTLSAGVVDDVVGWILLSVVSAMATTGVRAGDIWLSLLSLAIVAVVAATIARPVVRGVLRRANQSKDAAPPTAAAVSIMLLCAAATQSLGMEAVFGAFIGGIVIGSCRGIDLSRLAPLRTVVMAVFAPLFFATAGLRVDLTELRRPSVLLAAVVVLTIAIFGKFAGAYIGARSSKLTRWEALALGAGMNARGVIEVVVATVGLRLGVLSTATYTIVILVAVVTSLMAPPILRRAMRRVEQTAEERLRPTTRMQEPGFATERPN